jgi:hypothetical protein
LWVLTTGRDGQAGRGCLFSGCEGWAHIPRLGCCGYWSTWSSLALVFQKRLLSKSSPKQMTPI